MSNSSNTTPRFDSFSKAVKHHMNTYYTRIGFSNLSGTRRKKLSQIELADLSNLSRTTISRICRNSNDKGGLYQPKNLSIVVAVCIGLKLDKAESQELCFIAFPELRIWAYCIEHRLNIAATNIELDNSNLPLLDDTSLARL